MPRIVLTDISRQQWTESIDLSTEGTQTAPGHEWRATKKRLRGGRSDGVDVVLLEAGPIRVEVVPTRGMGIRQAWFHGEPVGWKSPVTDGPVHPSLVNLASLGGFGWLDGFDELLVRCGLEHNGPPADEPPFRHSLHGRIANLPAHEVILETPDRADGLLAIEGTVRECRMFGPIRELSTRIAIEPRSGTIHVHDTIRNLGDSPARLFLLYHWNFGPPYLGEGSRFLAPSRRVVPQTPRAAEGISTYDVCGPPQPGFAEQVYLFELISRANDGRTLALLRNEAGDRAAALRFSTKQLPCFTLWKCEQGLEEGYVTGLEPATNYPNPRSFEQEHGRYVFLEPGSDHRIEMALELSADKGSVERLEAEVIGLQTGVDPIIHPRPAAPYSPQG